MRLIAIIAACFVVLAGGRGMSMTGCDLKTLADAYIAKRYPFLATADRKLEMSLTQAGWELRYSLPAGALGFTPVVTIDPRTCKVVAARVEQ
jgi:hypothetical protein